MTTKYETTPQAMDELYAAIRSSFKVFAPPPMPSPLSTPPTSHIGPLLRIVTFLRRKVTG